MTKKKSSSSIRSQREQRLKQKQKQRRLYYVIAAVGTIIVIGLFAFIRQINAPDVADFVIPDLLHTPPNADGKAWGPVDAPVLIEEFSDFQ